MKKTKLCFAFSISILVGALLTVAITGCKTHLASGGAYSPGEFVVTTNVAGTTATNFVLSSAQNIAFYEADTAYNAAYSIVDAAFKWESDNRAQLYKLTPEIKHTLDKIRPAAWQVQQRWAAARQAYEANPIPANLTAIQTLVAQIQSLVPTVTAAEAMVTTNSVH